MKRIIGKFKSFNGKQIAVLALCFAFILTAIAGVIGRGEMTIGYKATDMAESVAMKSGSVNYAETATVDTVDTDMAEEAYDGAFIPAEGDAKNRVVTRNAELYIETEQYDDLMNLIESKVESLYGYVESGSEYDYESGKGRRGYLTVRVPAKDLDTFIESLEEKATIRTKTITADDITSDYVDTESRILALKTEQGTLIDLLSEAASLSDTIEIQERLTSVRRELQYYESMMARMNNEVDYSSVRINIDEVDHATASGSGFWYEIKNGFVDSLYDIAEGFKVMTIWFVSALPFVAILIVCGIIVKSIVKVFKKKETDRGEQNENECPGGQTDS